MRIGARATVKKHKCFMLCQEEGSINHFQTWNATTELLVCLWQWECLYEENTVWWDKVQRKVKQTPPIHWSPTRCSKKKKSEF